MVLEISSGIQKDSISRNTVEDVKFTIAIMVCSVLVAIWQFIINSAIKLPTNLLKCKNFKKRP